MASIRKTISFYIIFFAFCAVCFQVQSLRNECFDDTGCPVFQFCCERNLTENSVCRSNCIGQSCHLNSDCAPGESCCHDNKCSKTCLGKRTSKCSTNCTGKSCTFDHDCATGECCDSDGKCKTEDCNDLSSVLAGWIVAVIVISIIVVVVIPIGVIVFCCCCAAGAAAAASNRRGVV